MVLHLDLDLGHPPAALEAQKHKLKRLVQVRFTGFQGFVFGLLARAVYTVLLQ